MRPVSTVCSITLLALLLWTGAFGQVDAKHPSKQLPDTKSGTTASLAKLTASDGQANNELGYSVSISGDTIVVGAPYATVSGHDAQGAVYVFERPASGWADMTQTAKLTASDGQVNAFFGSSVSISGDTVLVGADGANIGTKMSQGAAYVFVKPAKGWADMTQATKLLAPDGAAKSYFGSSVSVSGDTAVVAADGANVGSNYFAGAVYLFVRPAKGWETVLQPSAKLIASDASKGDQLGYSVAIRGNTVVAGARSATVGANSRQGAAYLYVKPADGWKDTHETAKLIASDGAKDSQFGYAVCIDAGVVVVGAPGRDFAGTAYEFLRPADGWATTSAWKVKLMASDRVAGDQLGYALAISGDTVLAGAPATIIPADVHQDALYEFVRPATGPSGNISQSLRTSSGGRAQEGFGASVQLDGGTGVVGAPYATVGPNKYQGAGYVFKKLLGRP